MQYTPYNFKQSEGLPFVLAFQKKLLGAVPFNQAPFDVQDCILHYNAAHKALRQAESCLLILEHRLKELEAENAFMLKKILNPLGDLLEKYNEQST